MRSLATFSVWPLLLILLTFTAASGGERPKIIVGGDHDNPPYEFFENGKPSGFNIELIRAVSEVMGFDVEFRLGPWSKERQELEQGKIDALAGMYYSAERNRKVDFSMPHSMISSGLFVRKDSPVRSLEDIKGKEVIVQEGDVIHDYLRENGVTSHIVAVTNPGDELRLLASGRHDCALMPSRFQGEYLKHTLRLADLRAISTDLPPFRYCFAVHKGNQELLYRLDEGLNILKVNGRYQDIYEKWFGVYDKKTLWQTLRYYVLALALTLVLCLAFLIWFGILKRQVELRTAELRRKKEELRFTQYAIDKTMDQAFWTTKDGRLFYVNNAACRALGYTREELVGMSIPDIDPTHPSEVFARHWRDLQEKGLATFESRHRAKDGHVYPVEIRANYVVFDGKEYNCAFATDISERKRAEEELRESEEKFRVLAETSPACICVYQGEHHVYVNAAMIRLIGYTDQELMEMNFWDWIHEDFRESVRARGLARQRGEPVPSQYELKCITKNGEEKWLFISAGRIEYKGKPASIVTMFDITDRKRMEDELRQAHDELEKRVEERTLALWNANNLLQQANRELSREVEARKAAVEASIQSISLLKATLESTADGILVVDSAGSIIDFNERFLELWYIPRNVIVSQDDDRVLAYVMDQLRNPDEFIKKVRELYGQPEEESLDVLYFKDGRVFERYSRPQRVVNQVTGRVWSFRDITDRKRAEESLKRAKEEWERTFASVPDLIAILDNQHRVLRVNEAMASCLGLKPDECVRLPCYEAVHGLSEPPEFCPHTQTLRDGREHFVEVHEEHLGGDFLVSTTPLNDEQGLMIGSVHIAYNITERKRAEEALRESEARYHAIVDAFDGLIYICSQDYRIGFMNIKLIERTGYEAVGELCFEVMHDRDSVCPWCVNDRVFAGETVRWEMLSPKDNRWYYVVNVPVYHADGSISKYSMIMDITERKRAEEQLKQKKQMLEELNSTLEKRVQEEVTQNREKDIVLIQQNRMAALGEMFDHIAHQWKQPLNSISVVIQALGSTSAHEQVTGEYILETVNVIMDMVGHMAQTVDVFRDFYKPDKEKSVFLIKDTIDKALTFVTPIFRRYGIGVDLDADPKLSASGYPKEYAQVLLNILGNAKDAFVERGVENPRINIKAFADGDNTVVTITDNAGGVPDSSIESIFDLNFTTKESSGGTGIGLYMSRNIIEKNMGGELTACNIDNGAQFRIELGKS